MTDIVATVNQEDFTATVSQEQLLIVDTSLANPAVVDSISQIQDVDTTSLTNGSVLVYKTITNKWTSTTVLDAQDVTGGQY